MEKIKRKQSAKHIKKRIESRLKTMQEKYPNGIRPWNKGLTKKTDERVAKGAKKTSEFLKKKYSSKKFIHHMKKEGNEKIKKKISEGLKGNKNGVGTIRNHLKKTKKQISKSLKEKYKNGEIKIWNKGKTSWCKGLNKQNSKLVEKRSLKIRESTLKRIIRQKSVICYNEKSIPFFKMINKKYNLRGVFGKNEFKCIGYSLDFYSFKYNLIIEWDEKYHYLSNQLRKKDTTRQQNIINYLNCKFIRIKEWEDLNKYEEVIKLFIINHPVLLFQKEIA